MRKYKIDELRYARKKLYTLQKSGTATKQELENAKDELNCAQDVYLCDIGMDN